MKRKIRDLLIQLGYRSKPDFLIIGVQKAGTTALWNILRQHRVITAASSKEIHFFDNDEWYNRKKFNEYHAQFPLPHKVPIGAKIFEATPIYIFHPEIASRLHDYNPRLKLIILLRDPAERAFSAWTMYHHHFKSGIFEHLHDPRSFSEAIAEELEKIEDTTFYDNKRSYVKRGIYYNQIQAYLKHFSRNQIFIMENKELINYPEESLNKIQSFVNVPYESLKLVKSAKSIISEKDKYRNDLIDLQKFYKPYNKKLFRLIGREFNWD